MGCLTRIGCVSVLLVGGALGYWLYGDRLPSVLGRAARGAADQVTDVAARSSERLDGPEGERIAAEATRRREAARAAERAARDQALGWVSVTGDTLTRRTRARIALLRRANGPAYLRVTAAEAAALFAPVRRQLPPSARAVEVALADDRVRLRADLALREVAGDGALGSALGSAIGTVLGAALDGRDVIELAGPLEPIRPGLVQLRVDEVRLGGIDLPTRLIAPLVRALRRRAADSPDALTTHAPLVDAGIPVPLPASVADARVVDGALALYRAVGFPARASSRSQP